MPAHADKAGRSSAPERTAFKWRRLRGGKHGYDFEGQGRRAVYLLCVGFLFVGALYSFLHWCHPASADAIRVEAFVTKSALGIVTISSPDDIDWYVGPDKARPILTDINQRNQEIASLVNQVRTTAGRLVGLSRRAVNDEVGQLLAAFEQGCLASEGSEQACTLTPEQMRGIAAALQRLETQMAKFFSGDDFNVAQLETVQTSLERVEAEFLHVAADATGRDKARAALDQLARDLKTFREHKPRPDLPAVVPGALTLTTESRLVAAAAATERRNDTAKETLGRLQEQLAALKGWLVRHGDPLMTLDVFLAKMSGGPNDTQLSAYVVDLRQQLARLAALRRAQLDAVKNLVPPVKLSIFWMTPGWVVLEVLFWGLFGVLTNLLLLIAEQTRAGKYSPAEWVVHFSKILYGPVVSLALCLAMLLGLVHLAGDEVRVWALPLLSFFFGFNARKSAALVERYSVKLLGQVGDAIDHSEAMAASHAKLIESYCELVKPVSIGELRTAANQVAEDTVRAIVLRNESRS